MDLFSPGLGLIFWQTVTFVVVLFLLSRYAWKPILNALKEREQSIENSLKQAEKARDEMQLLQAGNEKLLDEARLERDTILKSAQKTAHEIREEAKAKADAEFNKRLEEARRAIETEKQAAVAEIKKQIASMSVEIAETLLRKELEDKTKQEELVSNLIKELKIN